MSTDLQSVPGLFMHVEVADGVLQAGLSAALRDRLGNGVDVEMGDLQVVVQTIAGAWRLPQLILVL